MKHARQSNEIERLRDQAWQLVNDLDAAELAGNHAAVVELAAQLDRTYAALAAATKETAR